MLMVNNPNKNQPIVSSSRPKGSRRKVAAIAVIVVALLAVIGSSLVYLTQLRNHADDNPSKDSQARVYEGPTEEEVHYREYVRQVSGRVISVSGDQLKIEVKRDSSSDISVLSLSLTDKTAYSKLNASLAAERSDVAVGNEVAIGYDKSDNNVLTVWVDYDKE